ncbi:Mettl15 [Columba livia]|nr:Mettl15 [Columba livia]
MLLLASEETTQMCRMRLFSSKMLSRCLCQVHKCVFLSNFKLNSINVATLARRIHSSAKKLSDSELKEQTVPKCETEEMPPSTEDNNFGRLHTPVMLEEVVNCLSPQPGQSLEMWISSTSYGHSDMKLISLACFLDMTFGAGGHTTALLEKSRDITVYALDRDPTAYKIAQQLSESYPLREMHHIAMSFKAPAERILIQSEQKVVLLVNPVPTLPDSNHTFRPQGPERSWGVRCFDNNCKALEVANEKWNSQTSSPVSEKKQIRALLGQFSQSEALLISSGVEPGTLDGVLLDAGCSSMQFDTPERGFSLQKDGPLDMRMDGDRYPDMPTAADVVNALDQQALASILRTYGEERHAKKIASAIVQARSIYPITRTQQLASIVAGAFPASALYARKDLLQRPAHVATKTFQGLRIFVNDELHELFIGLKTAEKFLKPGGRLVALSFHSLEDRIVKRFLHGIDMTEKYNLGSRQKIRQALKNRSKEEDAQEFPHGKSNSRWIFIQKKALTPQSKDIQTNPRGRSAKLRAAIKI